MHPYTSPPHFGWFPECHDFHHITVVVISSPVLLLPLFPHMPSRVHNHDNVAAHLARMASVQNAIKQQWTCTIFSMTTQRPARRRDRKATSDNKEGFRKERNRREDGGRSETPGENELSSGNRARDKERREKIFWAFHPLCKLLLGLHHTLKEGWEGRSSNSFART
eukprot:38460-Rhodomonas_salina.2